MSLIKAIRQQLGLSVTPANNFTLDASADNGTMKLVRGNAGAGTQDILTVDAAGKVALPQNVQTLQDVKASRVPATVYTNNTGQPITVMASLNSTSPDSSVLGTVNGNTARGSTAGAIGVPATITLVVPVGGTYSLTMNSGTAAIQTWLELR